MKVLIVTDKITYAIFINRYYIEDVRLGNIS